MGQKTDFTRPPTDEHLLQLAADIAEATVAACRQRGICPACKGRRIVRVSSGQFGQCGSCDGTGWGQ